MLMKWRYCSIIERDFGVLTWVETSLLIIKFENASNGSSKNKVGEDLTSLKECDIIKQEMKISTKFSCS